MMAKVVGDRRPFFFFFAFVRVRSGYGDDAVFHKNSGRNAGRRLEPKLIGVPLFNSVYFLIKYDIILLLN